MPAPRTPACGETHSYGHPTGLQQQQQQQQQQHQQQQQQQREKRRLSTKPEQQSTLVQGEETDKRDKLSLLAHEGDRQERQTVSFSS